MQKTAPINRTEIDENLAGTETMDLKKWKNQQTIHHTIQGSPFTSTPISFPNQIK